MARLNYVELTSFDIPTTKAFYEKAFGWTMTLFGPSYAATTTGDTDIGIQADSAEAIGAPLPVIEVENLEAALEAVLAAGGTLARPIFAFPGGRRFHVLDPGGNEIACVTPDAQGG
jgi:predicted enzyme related to lactoylglutathione lyase